MIAFEAASTQPGGIRRNLATLFVCTEAGMPVDAELGCLEAQLHRSSVVTEHIARLSERTIDPTRSGAPQGFPERGAGLHLGVRCAQSARLPEGVQWDTHPVD